MDKLKSLLLPIALIFAAVAIFEFGARYGASNTRAAALTGQLVNFTQLYKQVQAHSDESSRVYLKAVLDNHILTGALVRKAWYLKLREEPRKSLNAALTEALAVRGDDVLVRFEAAQSSTVQGAAKLEPTRYEEVRAALLSALEELQKSPPVEQASQN